MKTVTLESLIGAAAAFCTTASYVPQLRKAWMTGETRDLSLKMLLILAAGLGLWIIYGLLRSDVVIVAANAISLSLLACIIYFKMRERKGAREAGLERSP
jgi:MtN3 and saliva related transmembrane protein